ncbi:hypothetical protein KAI19_01045 [bacterium]|nr:hypothetical protein [bacterium]
MNQKKTLYLIDGNSYAYRSFYAIKDLKTREGLPTNAVYGFTVSLLKILRRERLDYIGIVFDLPEPTFRHKEFASYKANRPKMPDELIIQFPIIKEVIRAFNIPIFELGGYEADDIIATLAKEGEKNVFDVFVMSPDKDLLQIITDNIRVIRSAKKDAVFDRKRVYEKYGVEPEKLVDIAALGGDSSDNIPGVPGIGEKTASKLVKQFGDLDGVLKNTDKIHGEKIRKNLNQFSHQAELSRKLVCLKTDVPIRICWEDCAAKVYSVDFNKSKVNRLFAELGFNKLILT